MSAKTRLTKREDRRLRELIRSMNYRSAIYDLLKEELSTLGHWREKPRGKPGLKNFSGKADVQGDRLTYAPLDES